jgi:hypothetical protein
MAKTIKLKHEVEVVLRPVAFHAFEEVRHLDVAQYANKAKARIALGYFESGCCRRMASAVVQKGVVTRLELEPCKDAARPPKELVAILKSLPSSAAGGQKRATAFRMGLGDFLADHGGVIVATWTCYVICLLGYCFTCCVQDNVWTCASPARA